MKKFFIVLLAAAALASAEDQEARAKRVIDEAVAALGGQKFLNVQERIESGRAYSFYHDKVSGLAIAKIYTRYTSVDPAKAGETVGVWEREAFGKNEDYYDLFNEDGGWDITFRGTKPLEQDQINRYRDTTLHNVFYILRQRLHEPGLTFDSRGSDVVENVPVEIVDITDSANRVVTVYFQQSTKLPIMQKWIRRDPVTKDKDEEITRFALYREVGGIQWPHQIHRERNGEKIYDMFSETVTINPDLPDNLFSLPSGPPAKGAPKPVKKK